jgi:hypothetical protein
MMDQYSSPPSRLQDPDAIPPGVRVRAVVLGFAAMLGLAIGIIFASYNVLALMGFSAAELDYYLDPEVSATAMFLVLLMGAAFSVGGGFVAGRVAGRAHIRHAVLAALTFVVVFGSLDFLAGSNEPLWYTVISYGSMLPAAALGGWLSARWQPQVRRADVPVAMRVGILAALFAALGVSYLFELGRLITLLILAFLLHFAYRFTSDWRVRAALIVLLIPPILILGTLMVITREGYVSVSAPSPDGRAVAEVKELSGWIDYNFEVRLKTKRLGVIPRYKTFFRSPDEAPPGKERLLWSNDGRYILLLGNRFYTVRREAEACLASGEWLYLFVDTEKDVVYSNTGQVRTDRSFSIDDLEGIDFGISVTPGTVRKGRKYPHREVCTPRLEN